MTADETPPPAGVPTGQWSDRSVDLVISNILRSGVMVASSFVLVGGVIYLQAHGQQHPNVSVFHGEPEWLRQPVGIVRQAATGNGDAIIQCGVLLLLATPF